MIAKGFQNMQFFDANRCLTATFGRVSQERKAHKKLIVLEEENGTLEEGKNFQKYQILACSSCTWLCPSTSRLATPGDS